MPCHSYEISAVEISLSKERDQLKQELDTVTRLLCSVLRSVKFGEVYVDLTKDIINIEGLEEWWNEHKKWDELRLIREANHRREKEKHELIKNALAKLTDKEKEALGL
jgi:hypothetical protein